MTSGKTPSEKCPERREIPTSLEVPLVQEGDSLRIDLSDLPIFFGLSILARDIGEKVITRYYLDRVEVESEKLVKHSETPELAEMQIENIKVRGDYEVLEKVLADREAFHEDLKTVFGSLQMQRWRRHIYPQDIRQASRALVFQRSRRIDSGEYGFRIVMERLRSSKKTDKFFLRVTFEGLDGRRLDLDSMPHVIVENPEGRTFIAGATRLSGMLFEQVRWTARRGKRTYSEIYRSDSFIFNRLHEAGLDGLVAMEISWTEDYVERFRSMAPEPLTGMFKKILLLLEDHTVRSLLREGRAIRVDFGDIFALVDLSQLGRVINISFGHRRRTFHIDQYLDRMPVLSGVVAENVADSPLEKVKVLLIHHVTAEVLGLISALKSLHVEDVSTLFIHYGEDVPSDFLEALLDLDQRHFPCHALNHVEERLSVEGYFLLSPRFSRLDRIASLNECLMHEKPRYFDAMVRTATRLFLEILASSIQKDTKCLVVEDGGYLAPLLSEWAAGPIRATDLFRQGGVQIPDGIEQFLDRPMGEVLGRWLIGTVEHTKNGFDRLVDACNKNGALARPAFSIAVSDFKVTEEAREVAASVLSAVESVLHAQGKVLSKRKALVMGSEGAIGRHLVEQLQSRCRSSDPFPCLGVDIRGPARLPEPDVYEVAQSLDGLCPRKRSRIDLIVGVTGRPALHWEDVEGLLIDGESSDLFLASGSSKTIEFEDVSQGLDRLLKMPRPAVRGVACRINGEEVHDPQTRRVLGHKYRFSFEPHPAAGNVETTKHIWFLGSLMPINFLYYGVPGEVIDLVLAELLRCALGLARRVARGDILANMPYAVDRDIDVHGNPLGSLRAR